MGAELLPHAPTRTQTDSRDHLRIITLAIENSAAAQLGAPDARGAGPPGAGASRGFTGESHLLITPGGKTMLIDAGYPSDFFVGDVSYGENQVPSILKGRGIRTIDWLMASHPHRGHIGGMPEIILSQDIEVGQLLWSPLVDETILRTEGATAAVRMAHDLLASCAQRDIPVIEVKQGDLFDLGNGVACEILAAAEPESEVYSYVNNNSIVMRLAYGDFSMMFTGDAQFIEEDRILRLGKDLSTDVLKLGHHGVNTKSTDVMKLGHHGVKTKSSEEWVKALGAKVGVASMPRWLSEGPKGIQVYDQLTKSGMEIYRTWEHGHIEIQTDGSRFWVITA